MAREGARPMSNISSMVALFCGMEHHMNKVMMVLLGHLFTPVAT